MFSDKLEFRNFIHESEMFKYCRQIWRDNEHLVNAICDFTVDSIEMKEVDTILKNQKASGVDA